MTEATSPQNLSAVAALLDRFGHDVRPGDVARAITWCEAGGERARELIAALPRRAAHVVGITGPPGAGKSTLANALIRAFRADRERVGVLAVDPSSPLSGGALLGDRVRLEGSIDDRDVFFRSLASRGAAGGLSKATDSASTVLSAAGFGVVIVETVGAGQSEVEVMGVADTVVLVLIPGAGDDVQALKSGIMEIADVFVLNKADQSGFDNLNSHVRAALHLCEEGDWVPPIVEMSANTGKGIPELVELIGRHRDHLRGGAGPPRARAAARATLVRHARDAIQEAVAAEAAAVVADLEAGRLDETSAARTLETRAARRLLEER